MSPNLVALVAVLVVAVFGAGAPLNLSSQPGPTPHPARLVSTTTASSPPAGYKYDYPRTINYRALSNDPNIGCGLPDDQFLANLASEHMLGFTGYVTDAEPGTCGRQIAEQFKRLFPTSTVLWRTDINGGPPTARPGTWPGYYLMMNRSVATDIPAPSDTVIPVANPAAFAANDTVIMWTPTATDPFGNAEYVHVVSVSGNNLKVQRAVYGTVATFTTAPFLAATARGGPLYNLSTMAPVNPATGQNALQWLSSQLIAGFAADPGQPALDGIELDNTTWFAPSTSINGSVRNLDCNADGVIDYCDLNLGTPDQVDSFGIGYNEIAQAVRAGIQSYKLPGQPPKLLIGDSGFRAVGFADGAEFESYPNQDNYDQSSAALAQLQLWQSSAQFPKLSYAFTKDITPIFGQVSRQNPQGCVTPPDGNCRTGVYRYGLVSSLITGSFHAMYEEADNFDHATPFDEDATINTDVTGLAPGYLGQPLGPPVRQTRYTSGNLLWLKAKRLDLSGYPLSALTGWSGTTSIDNTVSPPGHTKPSVRVDVTQVPPDALATGLTVRTKVVGTLPAASEYTVDFWARSTGSYAPGLHQMQVALDGTPVSQTVLLGQTWQHIVLQFNTIVPVTGGSLDFNLGAETGTYWINGLEVRQGTAGIITRQYTNGIAVLNDSPYPQTNIPLPGGTYRRILGVQDPVVNDGSVVGSMLPSIDAKDGIVLLREQPYVASPDVHIASTSVSKPSQGVVDATLMVRVTPATGPTVIHYQTVDGTAVAGRDYSPSSGSITVPQGYAGGRIDVWVRGNTINEPTKTLTVQITSVDRPATIDPGGGTITIDSSASPPPAVSVSPASIVETTGQSTVARVPVQLSAPSGYDVTVNYATQAGNAVPGVDYVDASGSATIPAGSSTGYIPVTVLGDPAVDGSETVTVKLTGVTDATIDHSASSAPLIIFDDNGSARAAIGDIRVTKSAGHVQVPVVLAPASAKTVSVPYATSDGTAVAGTDYTATSGVLTFPPGVTMQTVTVPILDDGQNGPDTKFAVGLGTVTGAGVQRRTATVTIANDNAPPSIYLDNIWATEPAPPVNSTANIPVRLSGPSRFPITLSLAAENGTAKLGSDYFGPPPNVVIPAGAITAVVPVTIIGAPFVSGSKYFVVTATDATNASLAAPAARVVINGDIGLTPRLSITGARATDNDPTGVITFTVKVLPASTTDTTFSWFTADGSAVAGTDYVASSGTMTIPAGVTEAPLQVPLTPENLNQPDESFSVYVYNANVEILTNSGQGVIGGSQPPPTLSLTAPPVTEGTGTTVTGTATVTLSQPSDYTATVDLDSSDGTATAGVDYLPVHTTVFFQPGQTSVSVPFTVLDDGGPPGDKSFNLVLSNADHAGIASGPVAVDIADG